MMLQKLIIVGLFCFLFIVPAAHASEGEVAGGHAGAGIVFLWIAIILLAAKSASLIERYGQPAVLGELVMGMVLGNLVLIGIPFFEPIKQSEIIFFLSELGVVILLFQIGLESNLLEMGRVGGRAGIVAILGVVLPFALGTYLVGPFLLPGLATETYLFLGAALTATSVGITARVFQDLGKLRSPEAKIVLGAAVIDDVLGLIVLAVVSAIVVTGSVSVMEVSFIFLKAILFLGGTTIIGYFAAPYHSRLFATINANIGMEFVFAISIGLILAYMAELIGLAPIVGAFAAGLVLDPIHFRNFQDSPVIEDLKRTMQNADVSLRHSLAQVISRHSDHQIEDLIAPISMFFVPIFFVVTGMNVNLATLLDPTIVLVAVVITIVAILGKYVAGYAAGSVHKGIVGWGMVPRGEVGLIFAAKGKFLGVVSDEVFSVIVIMVILTTLVAPPMLNYLLKQQAEQEQAAAQEEAELQTTT